MPATDELHRGAHIGDARGEVAGDPVGVPSVRAGQPLAEPCHLAAGRARVELAERQLREQRWQASERTDHRQRGEPPLLGGDEHQPRCRRLQREAATGVRLPVELGGADLDRQRGQVIAGVGCHSPLHEAEIAGSEHPDPPGVPAMRPDPAQRGQAVRPLLERAEHPLRAERAAHALDQHL